MTRVRAAIRMLGRQQLHALIGRDMQPRSFSQFLWRAIHRHGFPRPFKMGFRSVAWREDEVALWLDSRERSGSAPKTE